MAAAVARCGGGVGLASEVGRAGRRVGGTFLDQ